MVSGLEKRKRLKSGIMFMVVALIILCLDQVSKNWVLHNLHQYQRYPVIPSFFNLTLLTNTGAAFGLMAGQERWRHLFFQVVSVMALCGLFYLYITARDKTRWLFWGCSFVFGGACGNLIDRMRFGHVIDFLDFYLGTYHWPAFNVADSAITIGGCFLALHFLNLGGK